MMTKKGGEPRGLSPWCGPPARGINPVAPSQRLLSWSFVMPTYQYEAMDTTGGEVKDTIDAASEEEAQQKIKSMGYFVTRLTEIQKKGKKDKKKEKGPAKSKKTKVLTLGGCNQKQLVTFPRQFSV